jgi:hypothetical protein
VVVVVAESLERDDEVTRTIARLLVWSLSLSLLATNIA